jgi:putative N-acetyltransferase (TIGR04045 family)
LLDATHPWGRPVRASLGASVEAELATEPWQFDAYFALRKTIFCDEQRLFVETDRDEVDAVAEHLVAMSQIGGMPDRVVGVVRIYRDAGDTWFGGRLGVQRDYRRFGIVGSVLIAAAVSTAHAHGCRRFFATVQIANVAYFERHHFAPRGPLTVCGEPHELMEADLSHYPPAPAGSRFLLSRVA